MNIFIVIPAFNEEKRIGDVIRELKKHKLSIIVVDDGSSDNTLSECQMLNVKCQILRHKVNLGKGAAMKTGAEAAFELGADAVVFMDSDGQHKAADLPKFIKALEKDRFEVVFGSRNLSLGVPFVRLLGNKFAARLISLLFGIYVSDLICGYRALTKKAYKRINWESAGYAVETEMVIKTGKYGLKYCEVPIETVYLDSVKGVTVIDALNILFDVFRWRVTR
jgi:glycosyltransferase involved in cell wall biosynthesis